MTRPPRVAVILSACNAHATIARCLESLEAQTFRDFETVVADSGTGDDTSTLVASRFPGVRYLNAPSRTSPDVARNEGVTLTSARILVFIDSDSYARPQFLDGMVRAHDETGEAIVGAIDCFGRRWLDRGVHLCKFSKWLPGGMRREVDIGPTAALLVRRSDYDAVGGFRGDGLLGDVELSHALRAQGRGLVLEPTAVVEHHSTQDFRSFIRERWIHGRAFGKIQAAYRANDRLEILAWLVVTALPVRLSSIAGSVWTQCTRAGRLADLLATIPVVALGHVAALGGEAVAYTRILASGQK